MFFFWVFVGLGVLTGIIALIGVIWRSESVILFYLGCFIWCVIASFSTYQSFAPTSLVDEVTCKLLEKEDSLYYLGENEEVFKIVKNNTSYHQSDESYVVVQTYESKPFFGMKRVEQKYQVWLDFENSELDF